MANDIDMSKDIDALEQEGYVEEANALLQVYIAWFINGDSKDTKHQIRIANKNFPDFDFDFGSYGIHT